MFKTGSYTELVTVSGVILSVYSDFETNLNGYLQIYDTLNSSFNPHNPIRYLLDEYIRWGLPLTNNTPFDARINFIAQSWKIVGSPEAFHPVQIDVAKEIKQRILNVKDSLPDEALRRVERGIDLYESGDFKNHFWSDKKIYRKL